MSAKPEGAFMTITGHLSELRRRIIRSVLSLCISFGLCCFFQDNIFAMLLAHSEGLQLIAVSPTELFTEGLKTAFLSGLFLSSPVILYQLCAFLWPGLKGNERKYLLRGLIIGAGLFMLGVVFAYCVIIPSALHFLTGISVSNVKPMYTLNNYMSFIWTFLVLFGLAFQVPMLLSLLALIGVVKPHYLRAKRKYCVLIIFILSAVLTPPDVVSQVLMALPLLVLYEFGILGAEIASRLRRR
ncbi:MAG: twin-arginine translocase subunit TatC [Synergistaceae bacterium]|nr:twin-arginine translocase subunit TatC [Synergistaceae bacterium]